MRHKVMLLTTLLLSITLGAYAALGRSDTVEARETSEDTSAAAGQVVVLDTTMPHTNSLAAYDQLPIDHDCAIALSAVHRLALNAAMADSPIHVECHAGSVHLTGEVRAPYLALLAENTVRQVTGVRTVQNDLTTARGLTTSDTAATPSRWDVELAEKKLAYDLAVVYEMDSVDIKVEAGRHAWCLRGNLDSEDAIAFATATARELHPNGTIVSALKHL